MEEILNKKYFITLINIHRKYYMVDISILLLTNKETDFTQHTCGQQLLGGRCGFNGRLLWFQSLCRIS